MELQIGEYTIPGNCVAKLIGKTLLVYERKDKKLTPTETRCKDCKHRIKGYTFSKRKQCRYNSSMVCELKPKEEKGLFYCAPLYGKPCEKFEKK